MSGWIQNLGQLFVAASVPDPYPSSTPSIAKSFMEMIFPSSFKVAPPPNKFDYEIAVSRGAILFGGGCTPYGLPHNQEYTVNFDADAHDGTLIDDTTDTTSPDTSIITVDTDASTDFDVDIQDTTPTDTVDASEDADTPDTTPVDAAEETNAPDIDDTTANPDTKTPDTDLPDTNTPDITTDAPADTQVVDTTPDTTIDTNNDTDTPVQPSCSLKVALPANCSISSIDAGQFATIAVKNGTIWGWGSLSYVTTLEQALIDSNTPQKIDGFSNITQADLGLTHMCTLDQNSDVSCVGDNFFGQLGDGTLKSKTKPSKTQVPVKIIGLSVGDFHACAWDAGGKAYCWGYNKFSQFGLNQLVLANTPQVIPLSFGVKNIYASALFTIFQNAVSTAVCGDNSAGQLGLYDAADLPNPETQTTPATAIYKGIDHFATGSNFTVIQNQNCSVEARGGNEVCQLGQNLDNKKTLTAKSIGISFAPNITIAEIFAHGRTGCALTTDGALYCWGSNEYGQTGTGSSDAMVCSPTLVKGLSAPVVKVAVGDYHTCIVDTACKVYCAGLNNHHQLGNANVPQSNAFIPTSGF
ncbi:MAG: hypothetical protein COV45_03335 [Deltaproteobacteria bacterium CG11_big_fil_rev_8_21_14_0_20_47_16]|nr:MAG: hypothetical protein COV45_03335 [Deltaproteobacteria bacterium CG11_big_fil_rev_8_21_14_0_20_47_16]